MRRAVAWPATLAILATFILAPTPAVADDGPAVSDPVTETTPAEAAPAEEPAAPAPPAETADPAEPQPEATDEDPPIADAAGEPAPEAAFASAPAPQIAAPVTSAVVASDLGISVSPASVLPGEDFTFSSTGCPFVTGSPSYEQLPVLQVIKPDLTYH